MKPVWYALVGGAGGFALGFMTFWAWWSAGVGSRIPFRQLDFGIIFPTGAGFLAGGLAALWSVRRLEKLD